VNEPPIDHILGVLGKLDVTAVAPGRAAYRQARTTRVGAVMLIVGRDWPVRSQSRVDDTGCRARRWSRRPLWYLWGPGAMVLDGDFAAHLPG
jgi:hypothetical protein